MGRKPKRKLLPLLKTKMVTQMAIKLRPKMATQTVIPMVTPLTVTQMAIQKMVTQMVTQKMVTKMVIHLTAKTRLLPQPPQLRKKKPKKIMVTPPKKTAEKRKAEEDVTEPIPVSAEKIAKLKESEPETTTAETTTEE